MNKKYFVSPNVYNGHVAEGSYEPVSESLFFKLFALSVMDMSRRDPWEYAYKLKQARSAIEDYDFSVADFVLQDCAFKIEK